MADLDEQMAVDDYNMRLGHRLEDARRLCNRGEVDRGVLMLVEAEGMLIDDYAGALAQEAISDGRELILEVLLDAAMGCRDIDQGYDIWRKGVVMLNKWPGYQPNEERLCGAGLWLIDKSEEPAARKLERLREVVAEVFNPKMDQEMRLAHADLCLNPANRTLSNLYCWLQGDKARGWRVDAADLFISDSHSHMRHGFWTAYDRIVRADDVKPRPARRRRANQVDLLL